MIGLPPSDGACHSMSIKSLSASATLGLDGASGAAEIHKAALQVSENYLRVVMGI